jgi:hypothetical protein
MLSSLDRDNASVLDLPLLNARYPAELG